MEKWDWRQNQKSVVSGRSATSAASVGFSISHLYWYCHSLLPRLPLYITSKMSRLARLVEMVRSLPPTPLRPQGSPQLSDALDSIISRQFPSASSSSSSATGALGEAEEQKVARMLGPLERLTAGSALAEVSDPILGRRRRRAKDSTPSLRRR